LANHPIVPRLYELRKGVADLEELDFSAGSVSDGDPILESLKEEFGIDPNEELTPEKKLAFMDWLQKTREVNGGAGGMDDMEDEEEEEEDEEDFGDFDESWKGAGLEQDELDDLLADADDDLDLEPEIVEKAPKAKAAKSTKSKVTKTKPDSESTKKRSKKSKSKASSSEADSAPTPIASFTPLAEPAFYSSKPKSKSSHSLSADDDTLGDATALLDADATDKERRTKTLRFHTSKIASTSNRRAAARAQRLGGDEDVPYRDRQKARDAALRKNSVGGQDGGEDLDGTEWTESDKKRAREVREEANELDNGDGDGDDGGAGEYYDLVKRRKVEKQAEKEAAHEERQAEKLYVSGDPLCLLAAKHLVHRSRTNRPMDLEPLLEPSKRTEVSHRDGTRLVEILVSKRGRLTRRPSKRSDRRGQCTKVGRRLLGEITPEKRLVSRLSSSRESFRNVCSSTIQRTVWDTLHTSDLVLVPVLVHTCITTAPSSEAYAITIPRYLHLFALV
jgi:U3 small nucleolar RNA-associated protein 3